MPLVPTTSEHQPMKLGEHKVARVLLADSDLASRLTLKSILSAAGYAVSGAATAAEAIGKLDESEYQLVLADLRTESAADAGPELLAYARQKEFRPATALISSDLSETGSSLVARRPHQGQCGEDEQRRRFVSAGSSGRPDRPPRGPPNAAICAALGATFRFVSGCNKSGASELKPASTAPLL